LSIPQLQEPTLVSATFEIIPAVDVLDGRVVRLQRGDYDRVTVYADDPAAQAASFMVDGAARVHVVDLAGARDGTHAVALWRSLATAGVEFQVGGGIRTPEIAAAAVEAGARRVVVGTAAVWHPEILAEIATVIGPERVVVAVDVRDGKATGAGWRDEGKDLATVLAHVTAAGVPRVLVTGIARDGMMTGPDVDLLAETQSIAPGLRVIASGGVGTLDHVVDVSRLGVEGVIIGRAIYEGAFTVSEAIAAVG
jgi:phosphoribosylformimino-5-aminoimidazole carboxamide ribotide isomerase